MVFPSPCGGELFQMEMTIEMLNVKFPSPCGDKLFPNPLCYYRM